MNLTIQKKLDEVYPVCRSFIDCGAWEKMIELCDEEPETFPERLSLRSGDLGLPEFLPEFARLEWTFRNVENGEIEIPREVDRIIVNPTFQLLKLSWKNLSGLIHNREDSRTVRPEPGEEFVILWRDPRTGDPNIRVATDEDLLVLKLVVEEVDPVEAASTGNLPVGKLDRAVDRAISRGILLSPESRIQRDPLTFPKGEITDDRFFTARVFTLQWHITQDCDLQCKHCYDRSNRTSLKPEKALEVLDDLRSFCRSHYVGGHVTFTGGNPLLYPHFMEIYRAASERGFSLAILGNPTPKERIEELIAIRRPSHFQVSLEGLPEHNDMIRGSGNFEKVVKFLDVLRDLGVYSMVMLTLTKDNMDQIIPLAEMLRGVTDLFTFNRLSRVGEGANLQLPSRDDYRDFLENYIEAARSNPVMGLKENLINLIRHHRGMTPFGGCAGFGCSAAFNFITLLPDGEVHACRKFPSAIGNIMKESIDHIYESETANFYRAGCRACQSCAIRPVCGGCMAVVHSHGLNEFEEKDPFCFIDSLP
jgi:selenobiotic family peptide radical SAM maturase